MKVAEIEKSKAHIVIDLIEYVPNSIVTRTIIRRLTGNINAIAIDSGESLSEKISPFDTYIQVIEGEAEIVIDNSSNSLVTGQGIVIPAHAANLIRANNPAKILRTIIKSGYEGIII
ncbi:MAG: cupin domain-containing protein [Anaerolineales bacterium]|jgi:quercetin dioxygenase-like cupin family protein